MVQTPTKKLSTSFTERVHRLGAHRKLALCTSLMGAWCVVHIDSQTLFFGSKNEAIAEGCFTELVKLPWEDVWTDAKGEIDFSQEFAALALGVILAWEQRERMIPDPYQWDWYGTWLLDWLCASSAHDCYTIWEKAYMKANSIEWMDSIELIENHYAEAIEPFNESPLSAISRALQEWATPWRWLHQKCWPIIKWSRQWIPQI